MQTTFYFPSTDQQNTLHASLWQPASESEPTPKKAEEKPPLYDLPSTFLATPTKTKTSTNKQAQSMVPTVPINDFSRNVTNHKQAHPKAILQIIHGMSEHILRYDNFAEYLVTKGLMVYGHDHLGHGKSCSGANHGYFAEKNASEILVEDCHRLTKIIRQKHPDTPLFILGHSMGSFILRCYLQKYSRNINGAIIMGSSAYQPPLAIALAIAKKLDNWQPKKVNNTLDTLIFGNYAKNFKNAQTKDDWLSRNRENIQHYQADPATGFTFTNNGFYTLLTLTKKATESGWSTTIRKNLPLLITSGEQDPVGQMGKGPKKIAQELSKQSFQNVTLSLYPHLRHEILNEKEAVIVYRDLEHWITHQLTFRPEKRV